MTQARYSPIPLPAAVLALSVAVCIGAAGPMEAHTLRAGQRTQAEQRETIEHLLDAIQQAARKLTDRLDGQSAYAWADAARLAEVVCCDRVYPPAGRSAPAVRPLRDALLNLPPPVC